MIKLTSFTNTTRGEAVQLIRAEEIPDTGRLMLF